MMSISLDSQTMIKLKHPDLDLPIYIQRGAKGQRLNIICARSVDVSRMKRPDGEQFKQLREAFKMRDGKENE